MTLQNNSQNTTRGSSQGSGGSILYFLAGGMIGAATALLFAPKKGADLRHDIADVTRKGYDGALDLTHRVQDQASSLYSSLWDRGEELADSAQKSLSSAKEKVEKAADKAADKSNDLLALKDAASENRSTGRRAKNIL